MANNNNNSNKSKVFSKKFVSMQRVLNLWRSMLSASNKEKKERQLARKREREREKRRYTSAAFSLSSIRIAN